MSGGEDLTECPLCMEPFDIDDVSFFPCTCGYQICRFCWHRIRTNENGLCPACRKAYPEDPAEFKPLTDDEVHRIKKDRRQKESQRKQKAAECRKHLTNIRVVQKNLVFVVGLSPRLCDAEILRRHEYFGKFGKIHKVVINQSTSYVGSQGPSASAYVTYFRPEDALAAIRTVNNLQIDGRTLKASLGTTKYCSHFLKNTQCLKPECMYLHDYGDEAASFSKEEIQQGKHLVYEQRLHEQYSSLASAPSISPDTMSKSHSRTKELSPSDSGQLSPVGSSSNPSPPDDSGSPVEMSVESTTFLDPCMPGGRPVDSITRPPHNMAPVGVMNMQLPFTHQLPFANSVSGHHLSLFSDSGFVSSRQTKPPFDQPVTGEQRVPRNSDTSATESLSNGSDWNRSSGLAANGNNMSDSLSQDDDLGFDPWDVSARALADLIEKEKVSSYRPPQLPMPGAAASAPLNHFHGFHPRLKLMPPGFTPNGYPPNAANMRHPLLPPHMAALHQQQQQRSRMLGLMQSTAAQTAVSQTQFPPATAPRMPFQGSSGASSARNLFPSPTESTAPNSDSVYYPRPPQPNDVFMWRDWQEGLKALLPNVNISFGTTPHTSAGASGLAHGLGQSNGYVPSQANVTHLPIHSALPPNKNWSSRSIPDLSWDPAIVNSGDVTSSDGLTDDAPPHWMASLHHLTEDNGTGAVGNTFGLTPSSPLQPGSSWMPSPMSSRVLPPGFGLSPSSSRPNQTADGQLLGERQMSAS